MKRLLLLIAVCLISVSTQAQNKPVKLIKVIKEYPCYEQHGNYMFPSDKQVKVSDSLKKLGFIPTGVRASGNGTILVTYFKAVK